MPEGCHCRGHSIPAAECSGCLIIATIVCCVISVIVFVNIVLFVLLGDILPYIMNNSTTHNRTFVNDTQFS